MVTTRRVRAKAWPFQRILLSFFLSISSVYPLAPDHLLLSVYAIAEQFWGVLVGYTAKI